RLAKKPQKPLRACPNLRRMHNEKQEAMASCFSFTYKTTGVPSGKAQCLGHARAIRGIRFRAMIDVAALDGFRRIAHGACRVVEQGLLLLIVHQAEQIAGLREVVIIVSAEIPTVSRTIKAQRRLAELGLLLPFAIRVWLVVQACAM